MFDAIIIGGGLAGCSAAIELAKHDHHVALIEADSYPRAKVCGEFLSPESVKLFSKLDFLDNLYGLYPTKINTVRITGTQNIEWRSKFPEPAIGISRYSLDEGLVNHAKSYGVTVYTNTRATDITGCFDEGFTVIAQSSEGQVTFTSQSVIVAHGKHSNLDRKLERNFSRKGSNTYIGIKQHFQGKALFEHIDLHTFPGGYCGISQVEDDRTNVCMLVNDAIFKNVTEDRGKSVDHFIDWICDQNREFAEWITPAIPLYPKWLTIGGVTLTAKPPIEDDILFVGDASGMVAPLAGDGMAMALHSGMIVAEALHDYLQCQIDAQIMKLRYKQTWQRTFQSRLRLSRFLQSFMLRQPILKPGLQLLNTFPALGDWLIANTRDMQLLD